ILARSSFAGPLRKSVNAAFKLRSAPPPRSRIIRISGKRGTGLASNAEIALVVLRQVADAIRIHVVPNLFPIPVRKEAHLPQGLAGGKTMQFDLLEILARRGLFAPQSCEPNVEGLQRSEERIDFAHLAAACRIGLVENAECRLLLRARFLWEDLH